MAVEWESVPSYKETFEAIYLYFDSNFKRIFDNYTYPYVDDVILESKKYFRCDRNDVILVLAFTVIWTLVRSLATSYVFKPFCRYMKLANSAEEKFPESAFRFLFYFFSWTLTFYTIVVTDKYQFFQKPSLVWKDWQLDAPFESDLYWIYIIQLSFYAHALYATLFLDIWRKDSMVLLFHHVLTLLLISVSHFMRYHKIGALVLLFHDICDIQLEFTKINVYMKIQNNKLVYMHEILANIGFLSFAINWFVSRLYWFPLKAIYAGVAVLYYNQLDYPFTTFLNALLVMLLGINMYWGFLIIKFLIKLASGQIDEIDDTREYDVEEKFEKKLPNSNGIKNGNSDVTSNGKSHKMD